MLPIVFFFICVNAGSVCLKIKLTDLHVINASYTEMNNVWTMD